MTTHLARYFHKRRLEQGLRLSEVALLVGYRRTDRSLSHGCNKLHRFEQSGEIDDRLLKRLMEALEVDQASVNALLQKDLEDWLRWADEPVSPYLVVRLLPGFYTEAKLPDDVRSVEEAERYASGFAKERRLHVCLVLSRRICVYFADDGTCRGAAEAVFGGRPAQPHMQIGGRRCRAMALERGIALPQVEWSRRFRPMEGK